MKEYHKIQSVFKRDPATKFKTFLNGQYSLPEFEYLKDNEWIFTEKIDGTNIRIMYSEGEVLVRGKTDKSQTPGFLIKKLNEIFTAKKMSGFNNDICLYGEGYGAKIQKGGGDYIPDGCGFILFDVMCGGFWLKREDVESVGHDLGIPVVPIVGYGPLSEAIKITSLGFKSQVGDCMAEGVVITPKTGLFARDGSRIITKIKTRDFVETLEKNN